MRPLVCRPCTQSQQAKMFILTFQATFLFCTSSADGSYSSASPQPHAVLPNVNTALKQLRTSHFFLLLPCHSLAAAIYSPFHWKHWQWEARLPRSGEFEISTQVRKLDRVAESDIGVKIPLFHLNASHKCIQSSLLISI